MTVNDNEEVESIFVAHEPLSPPVWLLVPLNGGDSHNNVRTVHATQLIIKPKGKMPTSKIPHNFPGFLFMTMFVCV
jgi:lantibiotic modifying enzyme